MFPIQEIDDATLAFPATVLHLMPKMEDIPEVRNRSKWNELFADWFYCGLEKLELKPKEGVDKDKALRHIGAIMGSFQPKHEDKEAAVVFLFAEWFEEATWTNKAKSFAGLIHKPSVTKSTKE